MYSKPIIGRNPPHLVTYAIFIILCGPTALIIKFSRLLVLRFLQGYFGSPCLATGGASMGDLYPLLALPYLLTFWVAPATCGSALGTLVSGFSVPPEIGGGRCGRSFGCRARYSCFSISACQRRQRRISYCVGHRGFENIQVINC